MCQIAEFIALLVRRGRGLHPGIRVAMYLLAWLGDVALAILVNLTVAMVQYCYDALAFEWRPCVPWAGLFPLLYALLALTYLLSYVVHIQGARASTVSTLTIA